MIPLSLYIHIPWCVQKCPYCDFNSHALKGILPQKSYGDQLLRDLEKDLPFVQGRKLASIFFGGGTPSLFSPDIIGELLASIQRMIPYDENIEITLEANPSTVDIAHFKNYRAVGINRLSIGIQSLQDEKLKRLGRIHDARTAIQAIEAAQLANYTHFNVDLMYGLPHQTVEDALADLNAAIALSPPHLSWYHLTLEPNTFFYHHPPVLPNEEETWHIQTAGEACLRHHGYQHYETSAYSQPGYACHHNLNYWEFGDYLGIGAGAHSKITDLNTHRLKRFSKIKHPKDYLSTHTFIAEEKIIAESDLPFEFMLNTLRLYREIPFTLFTERTGLSLTTIEKSLFEAEKKGLLLIQKNSFSTTALGQRFLNDLIALFMQ